MIFSVFKSSKPSFFLLKLSLLLSIIYSFSLIFAYVNIILTSQEFYLKFPFETILLLVGSLLMILGGALGNVFDRIYYKAVPDFIDFHIGNFHWFIFNVADIFITLGVFFMIILEFIDRNEEKKL